MARRKKKVEEPAAEQGFEQPAAEAEVQERHPAEVQPTLTEEPKEEPAPSEPEPVKENVQPEPEPKPEPKPVRKRKTVSEIKAEAKLEDQDVAAALAWMENLHSGDVDKAGVPYWMHPIMVYMRIKKLAVKSGLDRKPAEIAALLHDVVEHGHATVQQIEARFGKPTARIVSLLTRDPNLTYMEYIAKIVASGSREALAVKWADLIVNTDPKRLAKLPDADRNSLSKRYGNARKMVEKAWPFLKGIGERIDLKRKEA